MAGRADVRARYADARTPTPAYAFNHPNLFDTARPAQIFKFLTNTHLAIPWLAWPLMASPGLSSPLLASPGLSCGHSVHMGLPREVRGHFVHMGLPEEVARGPGPHGAHGGRTPVTKPSVPPGEHTVSMFERSGGWVGYVVRA